MDNKYILIAITLFLIMIESILIIKYNISGFNKKIIYIAIFGQIMVFVSFQLENKYLLELSHSLFGITIGCIFLFSKHNFMNYLALFALFVTIVTRKIFNGCLFLTSTGECLQILPDNFPAGLLYQSIFLLLLLKCLYYFW